MKFVNIDLYVRKKLFNTKYDLNKNYNLENNNEKIMRNIYDYINDNKITRIGKLTKIDEGIINFKNKTEGVIEKIQLKYNKKYYYNIEKIISKKSNKHNICFVNLRENDYNCLCFNYNSKETRDTVLILNDLNSNDDCIKCIDEKHKYKVGDILMQIFIEYVKNNKDTEHITSIELQDNSIKKCYNIGIKLKYLRTIMSGEPYYAKYGFRPCEKKAYEIYRYNRKLHKENRMLENKVVDKIFENMKDMNNKNPYLLYVNKYKKYILQKNLIDIKLFINEIIEKSEDKRASTNIDIETKKNSCELLSYAILPLYKALGYKDYVDSNEVSFGDRWELKIR